MFPETELILSKENRVYHINLRGEDIADNVIVVGDQNRVADISKLFSKIEFKTFRRIKYANNIVIVTRLYLVF